MTSLLLKCPKRHPISLRGGSKDLASKDLQIPALPAPDPCSLTTLASCSFLNKPDMFPPYGLCISCFLCMKHRFPQIPVWLIPSLFQLKRDHFTCNCMSSPLSCPASYMLFSSPLYSIHPTYCIFIYLLPCLLPVNCQLHENRKLRLFFSH